MLESVEEFGNRWRDRALEAEAEMGRLRAELAQAIECRDYWHQEAMSATRRIGELEAERQGEQRRCGYAQRHPSHTFMRLEVLFQCPGEHGTESKR